MVSADIDDVESLTKAFSGAYGAYCVTFYWSHFSPEKEKVEAANMAKAAKAAGLKHVVWSTLEDTRKWVPLSDNRMPTLMGNYKCPTSTRSNQITSSPTPARRRRSLASFYWENHRVRAEEGPDGRSPSRCRWKAKMSGVAAATSARSRMEYSRRSRR